MANGITDLQAAQEMATKYPDLHRSRQTAFGADYLQDLAQTAAGQPTGTSQYYTGFGLAPDWVTGAIGDPYQPPVAQEPTAGDGGGTGIDGTTPGTGRVNTPEQQNLIDQGIGVQVAPGAPISAPGEGMLTQEAIDDLADYPINTEYRTPSELGDANVAEQFYIKQRADKARADERALTNLERARTGQNIITPTYAGGERTLADAGAGIDNMYTTDFGYPEDDLMGYDEHYTMDPVTKRVSYNPRVSGQNVVTRTKPVNLTGVKVGITNPRVPGGQQTIDSSMPLDTSMYGGDLDELPRGQTEFEKLNLDPITYDDTSGIGFDTQIRTQVGPDGITYYEFDTPQTTDFAEPVDFKQGFIDAKDYSVEGALGVDLREKMDYTEENKKFWEKRKDEFIKTGKDIGNTFKNLGVSKDQLAKLTAGAIMNMIFPGLGLLMHAKQSPIDRFNRQYQTGGKLYQNVVSQVDDPDFERRITEHAKWRPGTKEGQDPFGIGTVSAFGDYPAYATKTYNKLVEIAKQRAAEGRELGQFDKDRLTYYGHVSGLSGKTNIPGTPLMVDEPVSLDDIIRNEKERLKNERIETFKKAEEDNVFKHYTDFRKGEDVEDLGISDKQEIIPYGPVTEGNIIEEQLKSAQEEEMLAELAKEENERAAAEAMEAARLAEIDRQNRVAAADAAARQRALDRDSGPSGEGAGAGGGSQQATSGGGFSSGWGGGWGWSKGGRVRYSKGGIVDLL